MRRERKSFAEIIASEYNEIRYRAEECGIDWSQISDKPGKYFKHVSEKPCEEKEFFNYDDVPTLDGFSNKCCLWVEGIVSAQGNKYLKITFHTKRHGGTTRVWSTAESSEQFNYLPEIRNERDKQIEIARLREKKRKEAQESLRRERDLEKRAQEERKNKEKKKKAFLAFKEAFVNAPRLEIHPYLTEKGISEIANIFDLREVEVFNKKFMAYAFYNKNGSYVGIQRFTLEKAGNITKKFSTSLFKGMFGGSFSVIGDLDNEIDSVYVAEGFANAASIHLATKFPCVIAGSADNLDVIVNIIKNKYPDLQVIIAADNDRSCSNPAKGNPGLKKALEAAHKNKVKAVVPEIYGPLQDGIDWNDLFQILGPEKLRDILFDSKFLMKPPKKKIDYLLQLATLTPKRVRSGKLQNDMRDLIKKIAFETKIPFLMNSDILVNLLVSVTDLPKYIVAREVKAVELASYFHAKSLCTIDDKKVDNYFSQLTEQNESGYWVISDKTANKIFDHLALGDIVIVQAPLGSGKNEKLVFRAFKDGERVAQIVPRVTLTKDSHERMKRRFSKPDEKKYIPEYYKDIDDISIRFTDKVVGCINSMGGAKFGNEQANWFDNLNILCLDEASQMIPQITELGRNKEKTKLAFDRSIQSAESILITDADANEYLYDRLREICPNRKITVFDVQHPEESKKWNIHFTDDREATYLEIEKAIKSKEKVLIATDSKRKAKNLEKFILDIRDDLKILNIHREPKEENKNKIDNFIKNPSEEIVAYDVLIYSPAITSGVSITTKHFTRHFGIFNGTIKPNDAIQMMARDRTSINWLLHLSNSQHKRIYTDRIKGFSDLAEGEATSFTKLRIKTEEYEESSRFNNLVTMLNILNIKGHKTTLASSLSEKIKKNERKSIASYIKETNEQIEMDRYDLILNQEDITESEYNKLNNKDRWLPTEEEAAAIIAYRVRHLLCADLTETNVEFIDKGGLKKIALFETLTGCEKDIKLKDKEQKESGIDISLRYFGTEKRNFLDFTISTLGLDTNLNGEFTHKEAAKVLDYFFKNADKVNILFGKIIDSKEKPRCATTFVKKVLNLIGLKVDSRKSNGNMIRFIDKECSKRLIKYKNDRARFEKSFIKQPDYEIPIAA